MGNYKGIAKGSIVKVILDRDGDFLDWVGKVVSLEEVRLATFYNVSFSKRNHLCQVIAPGIFGIGRKWGAAFSLDELELEDGDAPGGRRWRGKPEPKKAGE